jgi:hypothetical protein
VQRVAGRPLLETSEGLGRKHLWRLNLSAPREPGRGKDDHVPEVQPDGLVKKGEVVPEPEKFVETDVDRACGRESPG